MVNHVRTLLLNRGRDGAPPSYPGEEYVPPDFQPRKQPLVLTTFRRLLFGTDPDRLYINYRLRQYLTLVHASELAPLAVADDTRLSYDAGSNTGLFDEVFGETGTPLNNAGTLHLLGDPVCDEGRGRCTGVWRLTVATLPSYLLSYEFVVLDQAGNPLLDQYGNPITDTGDPGSETGLLVERRTPSPLLATGVPYVLSQGLSNLVTLPGSTVTARIGDEPLGASWLIESRARPQRDPSVILSQAAAVLGEQLILSLFPLGGDATDDTLRSVWMTHPITTCRHAALLIGLARRTAEQPAEAA